MNFDHCVKVVELTDGDFPICRDCGAPVGRDRDIEWEHLDEPGRRLLMDDRPAVKRSWENAPRPALDVPSVLFSCGCEFPMGANEDGSVTFIACADHTPNFMADQS